MQFKRTCLESFGYTLPKQIVSSTEIEHRLAPLYQRLRLPEGRLELMSGISERRFWPETTSITEISIQSAENAIAAAEIPREAMGALMHGSVCRDFLEPATACGVHAALGLPAECVVYDISNACLGLLNGMLQVASMIELGQIKAGIVVGTESGTALVNNTIKLLNEDRTLTRATIKDYIASLTIGSASVAMLLCDKSISQTGNRLTAASCLARTSQHSLCQSEGLTTLMRTDSERLLNEGIATGKENFARFLQTSKWTRKDIGKTFCHQVGVAHKKLLFDALELDTAIDFGTLNYLGNTGAAALPVSMAIGLEKGHVVNGDRVAMLGIGSGINCVMIGAEWNSDALVQGGEV